MIIPNLPTEELGFNGKTGVSGMLSSMRLSGRVHQKVLKQKGTEVKDLPISTQRVELRSWMWVGVFADWAFVGAMMGICVKVSWGVTQF